MIRTFIIYISAIFLATAALYYAGAEEHSGFRTRMIQFIEKTTGDNGSSDKNPQNNVFLPDDGKNETFFKKGEWSEYVSEQVSSESLARLKEGNIYSDDRVNINSAGSVKVNLNYGKSSYTNSRYKQFDTDQPRSRVINSGFWPEQITQIHMDGTIGDRITVFIDHDSRRPDQENHYIMNYRAVNDDEVLREINAGEIDIKFNHSKYAVFDNTDAKGLGVDFKVKKGDFSLKAFGSLARGETAIENFKGNSSPSDTKISDYQYLRGTYYQLEPFKRYDNVPDLASAVSLGYSSVTLTSKPSDPATYTLTPVNISPTGFELYIDDQNQYNNNNAILLSSIDGGYYTKMVNGSDYSINYTTGVIHFLKSFPESSRIFAVYNRSGGTLDPCAMPSGPGAFAGRIFVFIKYGYSIGEDNINKNFSLDPGEDKNNDGRLNLDIYEIRSVYSLGSKNILASDFKLKFFRENQVMQKDDIAALSRYNLELTEGTISFYTREPFRGQLAVSDALKVYSEAKNNDSYIYSKFHFTSEYNVEARSFKLKHNNVIEKSVRIKINERDIPSSYYSVDYVSGFVTFTNSNNPVISSDSRIEIKYEYLPFGTKNENFVGGVRGDYNVNKSLRIGGSIMLSKDGMATIVPDVGKESQQTLLFEGDAALKLSQARLADLYNIFAERKKKIIPAEFSAYAEYAKSFKDVNTFGKALIDNMETTDEIVSISLVEKDWVLSSMPYGYTQLQRGKLNYYFYRNPGSPDTLQGAGFSPYAVDYSVKPGPFNIAMGHVDDSIIKQDQQRSLVFDFNFTSGPVVTAVTRKLSDTAVDLSGMQYIELWVKYEGGAGDTVDLRMDMGSVDEDSDGDGVLDTEDANRNGYIDSEPSSGYSEDRGYVFNPTGGIATRVGSGPGLSSATMGDGVLNSEDLDGNGVLDRTENVYTVKLGSSPGSAAITPNGGVWQQIRVYIDWKNVTPYQLQTLKQTKSLRLYLTQASGNTGRVYIDTLKVVSSKWKNPEYNDSSPVTDPSVLKITQVNSINDSEYRNDSFLVKQRGVYESLYGKDSINDIGSASETALQLEYNIPGTYSGVSIKRQFSKVLDLRFYKTMNIWFNARSFNPSNVLGFIIGSSDTDYVEYRVNPDFALIWKEIKLKLSDDSGGNISRFQVTGNPDLKRIKYIKAVIYGAGTSGKIWLNEIYVSEPEKLAGDAHWYEFELKTLQPLFVTDSGVPVLSDMNLRYIFKGHSSQFNTLNKTSTDIKENYHELFTSAKILPNWDARFTYINETSSTDSLNEQVADSKKGDSRRDFLTFSTAYNSTGGGIPSVTFNYSFDKNKNLKDSETNGTDYKEGTVKVVHTPVVIYRQDIADFLYGKLSLKMMLDMVFSRSSINRESAFIPDSTLSLSVPLSESEKKQESVSTVELDYSNNLFYFRPHFNTTSREIVQLDGADNYDKTGVVGQVKGGFHLPFGNNDHSKYIERNNGTSAVFGIKFLKYLLPEYSVGLDYRENDFKDFKDSHAIDEGFTRSKDSISNLTTSIKLPVLLGKSETFRKVKHLQFNYKRSIYFYEKDVPYEGEEAGLFNEKYGISNVFSGLSSPVYNLIARYPGFYFRGRGNGGEGRDLIYNKFNNDRGIKDISSTNEYNNSLKLMDTFTTDLSVDLNLFKFYSSGSISQVCERSNIYGTPNQVIIADSGMNFEFDAMKIFTFGFFRSNGEGLPYHSSIINIGLNFTDSMLITYNIDEKKIAPSAGIIFKWDRSSLAFKYGFEFREKTKKEFINADLAAGDRDYIYLLNMEGNNNFREKDFGHKFSTIYETDVGWIYYFFSNFYKLTGIPVFTVEYKMEINRYDYFKTVSPEPYDLYMVTTDLKMDLHKNVQGGISGKMAVENFRNRENNGISKQVISYGIIASISFIF